jgi:hypothetical protein
MPTLAELVGAPQPSTRRKTPGSGWVYVDADRVRRGDVVRLPNVSGPAQFKPVAACVELPDLDVAICFTDGTSAALAAGARVTIRKTPPTRE